MSEPQVYITETTPEPYLTITVSTFGAVGVKALTLSYVEARMVLAILKDKLDDNE